MNFLWLTYGLAKRSLLYDPPLAFKTEEAVIQFGEPGQHLGVVFSNRTLRSPNSARSSAWDARISARSSSFRSDVRTSAWRFWENTPSTTTSSMVTGLTIKAINWSSSGFTSWHEYDR